MPQVCSCVLLVLSPETLERTPATLQNAIGASVRRAGPFSKQYENLDRLNNFDCYRVGEAATIGPKAPFERTLVQPNRPLGSGQNGLQVCVLVGAIGLWAAEVTRLALLKRRTAIASFASLRAHANMLLELPAMRVDTSGRVWQAWSWWRTDQADAKRTARRVAEWRMRVASLSSHGVRQTWAQEIDKETSLCPRCKSKRTIKYFFVLGDEATAEEKENRHIRLEDEAVANASADEIANGTMKVRKADEASSDIIALSKCSSDYIRLAEKVRKAVLFATKHYSFRLLLKTDTDSWIFLDTLLAFAEANELFTRRYVHAGDMRRSAKPQKPKSGGKNIDEVFVTRTGQDTYPIFNAGCGYLLTRALCNYIAILTAEDPDLPGLFELPQEDVAVGFWLQALQHDKLKAPVSPFAEGCRKNGSQRTKLILDHYVPPGEMQRRANNLRQYGNPCGKGPNVLP
ncbi:w [Symbiodinium pilosum]|uniref:Hexosyltransferase n=1 Tax=Symbiodinium pilosum TaxID=2952 RepID=A0A812XZV5_SYMPI|nr:w [Symbiodinium pilosum] [Symbiodinium pilosum]